MQIAGADAITPGRVEVIGPSLMLDLSWCVHGAYSNYLREAHPILDTLYGQNDDLRSRVRNFWSDGMNCSRKPRYWPIMPTPSRPQTFRS